MKNYNMTLADFYYFCRIDSKLKVIGKQIDMKKLLVTALVCLVCNAFLQAEGKYIYYSNLNEKKWVDSVFNTMKTEDKIGQLIIIRSFSDKDAEYETSIENQVKKYKVGGICFFRGKALSEAQMTNKLQAISSIPLFITIDGEYGVAMRLTDVNSFPFMMTLGATNDTMLARKMGILIGKQCKRLGINVNFAPVVDINNNINNPVINFRSLGDNRERVSELGIAYMKGQQSTGILASAKHFPGHGDTDVDSHHGVPSIKYDTKRLDSIELYPFKRMIDAKVASVMVGHINIPTIDPAEGSISSRSKAVVTDLLKDKLGFKGLIFTDGLEMQGFAGGKPTGEAEVEALIAGNDILLVPLDVDKVVSAIKTALNDGTLSMTDIDLKCKKILTYKYRCGLSKLLPVDTQNLLSDLNTSENKLLVKHIFESAVTIVNNKDSILPIRNLGQYNIASVSIGGKPDNSFQKMIKNYASVTTYNLPAKFSTVELENILKKLSPYNLIIVDVQQTSMFASKKYGIDPNMYVLVNRLLDNKKKVILNIFANPYALAGFEDINKINGVVCSYQDRIEAYQASAQVIFGALPAKGILPFSINKEKPSGFGMNTQALNIFRYIMPEEINADIATINKIDTLINDCIKKNIFPGCQIFAAKDGKVFINKSYGTFAYDDRPVTNDALYDLASLTKILATTPAIMKLYDQKKIDLNANLGKYFPTVKGSDKAGLSIEDIMIHKAGLQAGLSKIESKVKLLDTREGNILQPLEVLVPVAQYVYTDNNTYDIIIIEIMKTKIEKPARYIYSDLGFIMLKYTVEDITSIGFENYLTSEFYKPLGLSYFYFNPRLKNYDYNKLIPTVNDTIFRKQILLGDVHDPRAALLGGVAGHAGLFGNANDVGIMMQMFLQGGNYGNIQYFSPETVQKFTSAVKTKNSHRGLGFNKPVCNLPADRNPAGQCCPESTFGHTGFTGTSTWADPDNNIVFVFLSNRLYPSYGNVNILSKNRIREQIQELVYKSLD